MKKSQELINQIKHYNLQSKLENLARKNEEKRPFKHLPKQFSKGILIGNIAIVPRKSYDARYEYIIADMVNARIMYEGICLKQTAILSAHYLADNRNIPSRILKTDEHFNSKIFEIKNFTRLLKQANLSEEQSFLYKNKIKETNLLADQLKQQIQEEFDSVFRSNSNK